MDIPQRMWDIDTTVCNNNLDHVVEWIGNGASSSNAILQAYMAHFDFKALKLEQAFRNLCGKLHLKGETQQLIVFWNNFLSVTLNVTHIVSWAQRVKYLESLIEEKAEEEVLNLV